MVPVVQLVRASDCGSECRGFESHRAPSKETSPKGNVFFCEKCKLNLKETSPKGNVFFVRELYKKDIADWAMSFCLLLLLVLPNKLE